MFDHFISVFMRNNDLFSTPATSWISLEMSLFLTQVSNFNETDARVLFLFWIEQGGLCMWNSIISMKMHDELTIPSVHETVARNTTCVCTLFLYCTLKKYRSTEPSFKWNINTALKSLSSKKTMFAFLFKSLY